MNAGRVDSVDLARGVALIGMVLIHVGPHWVDPDPPIGIIIASGRAAPLFAMLAGVALMIVHQRDPYGAGSTRATWIRAALLIVLGLSLGALEDMPVLIILAFYGVLVVLALPFRRLRARTLLALAVAWAVVAPVVVIGAESLHDPVLAGQAELSDLRHPIDLAMELVVWGAYPAGVWFAYVLVGLALGRLDLRSVEIARRLVVVGAGLVLLTLTAGWILIRTGMVDDPDDLGWRLLVAGISGRPAGARWNDLLLVGSHTSTPLNLLSSGASAVLVIGLCALVVQGRWARQLLTPIRAAGAMMLTVYTVHVLWAWRLRVNHLEEFPGQRSDGAHQDWLLQVVVLCAIAALWWRFVGKGPLEWLMRQVSIRPRCVRT
ncbi:DUF418 domain-containing protein [Aeromicrobium sp. A1-2]|uniref:DUF418 domain-containing protein n=1 Tax=Aeromicrobium sp. A1-2 TaxID=2107713 RepID=UPI0013C2F86B|nr:DUF418 domain-containing protein [Aeromicrobium sp. A1-2]